MGIMSTGSSTYEPACLTESLQVMADYEQNQCTIGTRIEFTAGNSGDPYGKFDSPDISTQGSADPKPEGIYYSVPVSFKPDCLFSGFIRCLWLPSPLLQRNKLPRCLSDPHDKRVYQLQCAGRRVPDHVRELRHSGGIHDRVLSRRLPDHGRRLSKLPGGGSVLMNVDSSGVRKPVRGGQLYHEWGRDQAKYY